MLVKQLIGTERTLSMCRMKREELEFKTVFPGN